MSATSFLRHRRAVAAKVVQDFAARGKKAKEFVENLLVESGLAPADLANLDKNNEVLRFADDVARAKLDQPELDDLEEIGTFETGDRANVHSPDVREDQFEDALQHPAQETVGVGNMHDGPQAAEDLANVGRRYLDLPAVGGDLRKGAAVDAAVHADALARGTGGRVPVAPADRLRPKEPIDLSTDEGVRAAIKFGEAVLAARAEELPEVHPSSEPAADGEHAPAATESGSTDEPLDAEKLAESAAATADPDKEGTDPKRTQEDIAATPVDVAAEADKAKVVEKAEVKMVKVGEDAIRGMDRDQLTTFVGEHGLDIGEVKERTPVPTIRARVVKAAKEKGLLDG